jgi:hypothetical protein
VHYNGDPAFIQKFAAKLDTVDGLAFLLVKPEDLQSARDGIAKHPNQFIGFGEISLDDPRALDLVDNFQKAGFRGLGEITSPLKNYDDRSYWPIYERAEMYRMTFTTPNRSDPRPQTQRTHAEHLGTRRSLASCRAHFNPDHALPVLTFTDLPVRLTRRDYTLFKSFWWSDVSDTPKNGGNAFENWLARCF